MAVIHIDGTTVEVDSSDNLLQACLSLGLMCRIFVITQPLAQQVLVVSARLSNIKIKKIWKRVAGAW